LNKLYLRIPAAHAAAWPDSVLAYAFCSKEGAILREGRATLTELSKDIFKSKIVLLIAAADVTLLEITVPPMPEAKLRLALPNLVEDQLMSDSGDSLLVLAPKPLNSESRNKRTVAVVRRNWLQQISSNLYSLGASYIKALPEVLCLPYLSGHCAVAIEEYAPLFDHFSVRFNVDSGIGILLEYSQGIEGRLSAISQLVPSAPIMLQLPIELNDEYRSAVETNEIWKDRITIQESNWSSTIDEANKANLNLMWGLNSGRKGGIKWRVWQGPLILATLTLVVNIIGLNWEYWGMKREAQALKMGIAQTYKMSFPKDSLAPYPLEQMRKNLEIARRNSGEAGSNDFTVLLTAFGGAWSSINPGKLPKIVAIEYKDHALLVQIKGDMPQGELARVLSAKGLNLKKHNAEIWQIRDAE
jgi:general secretion pathway protein L